MKIVFMGTPEFAVPSLESLIQGKNEVCAVFTQPDKPKGRGYQLACPPVKEVAIKNQIPVYQPVTLKDGTAFDILQRIKPDVIVVVAYGKFLPSDLLHLPTYGCINVHASLLPKYRGAGPIQWAILNGEKETGVTTMFMAEGMDTGDMILKSKLQILPDETADELHDRLSVLGAKLLTETLPLLENGTAPRIKQDESEASYAPMLTKELSPIDFSKTAQQVHDQIRGLSSWPAASVMLQGKRLKIFRSRLAQGFSGEAGQLLDEQRLIVGCADGGAVEFLEVQYEGGKRMDGCAFLRGRKLSCNTKLT